MNLEILLRSERLSGKGSSVEASPRQLPARVEHLDCAEMIGGCGTIEQDQIAGSAFETSLISGDSIWPGHRRAATRS